MSKKGDKFPYIKLQYDAHRKEIIDSKERSFKIIIGGTISVPAAEFLGAAYDGPVIVYIAPLLIITLMLIYLSENNSIMRAGKFLREEIEPLFTHVPGWENWLEMNTSHQFYRKVYLPQIYSDQSSTIVVQGIDALIWALGISELKAVNEQTKGHFEDLRYDISKTLRKLVEHLPEPPDPEE